MTKKQNSTPDGSEVLSLLRSMDVPRMRHELKKLDAVLNAADPTEKPETFVRMQNTKIWGPAVDVPSEPVDSFMGPELKIGSELNQDGNALAVVSVDGYHTFSQDEAPEVIAHMILTRHGDVIVDWHKNNIDRSDAALQAVIRGARFRLCQIWKEAKARGMVPTEWNPGFDIT